MNAIYISWSKGIRTLFRLQYRTHNYLVLGIVECISVKLHGKLINMHSARFDTSFSHVRILCVCREL